ncbi:MAG TPA: nuclear transport factor 2 family protein [Longimicrobiales bacterium]
MKLSTLMTAGLTLFIAFAGSTDANAQGKAQAANRDEALTKIVATERAFAKFALDSAAQKGFDRYLAHDAYVFRPRAMKASEAATRAPLPANLALAWEPEWADASRAGDLGYTTGPWVSGARNNAQADPRFGQYLTIWRRQADGTYLGVLDGGVATPASATSPQKLRTLPASGYAGTPNAAKDKASLLRADNSFAAAAKTSGYSAAVKTLATPDMRLLRNGATPVVGADSVAASTNAARVTWWVPVETTVAESGDFGYTRGTYVITLPQGRQDSGDYVRIWKRDAGGAWRIGVDLLMPAR